MPILRVSGGLLSSSQPTLSLIWSGKEHLLHGRTGASLQGARQEGQTGEVISSRIGKVLEASRSTAVQGGVNMKREKVDS